MSEIEEIDNETKKDEEIDLSNYSFPESELTRLDEMLSRPRWVIFVLRGGALEILLQASRKLSRRGLDTQYESCQRFFREGLSISFARILMDNTLPRWRPGIQKGILRCSQALVDLIVVKIDHDCIPILNVFAILFNPTNQFHSYNSALPPESYSMDNPPADDQLFARSMDSRFCNGRLVDLINRFGSQNGFEILTYRFLRSDPPPVKIMCALLIPFRHSVSFLTKFTLQKYFSPILKAVPKILRHLSNKELEKFDIILLIIKCLKRIQVRLEESEENMKELELLRLRMIFRMVQVSSFKDKCTVLSEINRFIQIVQSLFPLHHNPLNELNCLSFKQIVEWFAKNQKIKFTQKFIPCVICLSSCVGSPSDDKTIGEPDPVSTICGHIFHRYCLEQHIENDSRCPKCRQDGAADLFIRIYPDQDFEIVEVGKNSPN